MMSRWRLVPVEPTPLMVAAMAMVDCSGKTNGKPRLGMAGACEAYEEMLAAAPQANSAVTDERMAATITAMRIERDDLLDFVKAFKHLCTVYPETAGLMCEPQSDMVRRAGELIAKQGETS